VNGAVTDKKLVDIALDELTTIAGQKAVFDHVEKDISNFKLRKNMPMVQELHCVVIRCLNSWIA